MDDSGRFQSIKNRIAGKLLAAFFLSAGIGTLLFFLFNYIIMRNNILNLVTDNHRAIVNMAHDAIDLTFRDPAYREKFFKTYEEEPAAISLDSRFSELKSRLKAIKVGDKGYIFVINERGDLIIHPDMEGQNISQYTFVKEILKKKSGVIDYDWKGKKKIIAFQYYEPLGWIVAAGSYYEDFLDRPMNRVVIMSAALLSLLTLVMFIVLYRMISVIIVKPINLARDVALAISKGDLSFSIPSAGSDEIGEMTSAMAEILTAQRAILSTMLNLTGKLSSSSEQMAVISNRMSRMSQDQAAAMEETSAALEQTLASMEQIAGRSEMQFQHVDENASRMGRMTNEAKGSYDESLKVTDLITSTAESARRGEEDLNLMVSEMQKIKESTSKIAEIIKIISDISEQVNLLSLNAAIEAARAGEHGKGFAVVADEISKLADETAQSAKNITQLVKEGNAQVDGGTAIVNRTAQTFHKIIESIETVRGAIAKFSGTLKLVADTASEARGKTEVIKKISNEISTSTKEQMTTNKEMSSTVERVNAASQELVNHADAILKMSQEIGEIAAEIKIQLEQFKLV